MALIRCSECNKEISDKAPVCPYCGKPMSQAKTMIQLDSAPHKRRKYRVRILVFAPMFFFGFLFAVGWLFSGEVVKSSVWFFIGIVGFVGMVVSAIGHWLAEP